MRWDVHEGWHEDAWKGQDDQGGRTGSDKGGHEIGYDEQDEGVTAGALEHETSFGGAGGVGSLDALHATLCEGVLGEVR